MGAESPTSQAEPALALRLLMDAFADACLATGVMRERRIDLGGSVVALRFSSELLERTMFRALAHLETTRTTAPNLTISAWDTATSRRALPVAPVVLEQYMAGGMPSSTASEGILASLGRPNPGVSMLDLGSGQAVYAIPDAHRVPHPDLSGPFVTILSWWFNRHGLVWLHGAVVGDDDEGTLIVGRGGSGKSTTSLACVRSGMSYVGDDYCLVEPVTPTAFSVSNGGKLALHAIDRLPDMAPHIINPDSIERHKGVVYVHEVFPSQVRTSLRLKSIVFPVKKGVETGRLTRMSAGAVLRELAPSSLLQLSAGEQPSLARMAGLARTLPAFALELPSDLSQVPNLVKRALRPE